MRMSHATSWNFGRKCYTYINTSLLCISHKIWARIGHSICNTFNMLTWNNVMNCGCRFVMIERDEMSFGCSFASFVYLDKLNSLCRIIIYMFVLYYVWISTRWMERFLLVLLGEVPWKLREFCVSGSHIKIIFLSV